MIIECAAIVRSERDIILEAQGEVGLAKETAVISRNERRI